MGEACNGMRMVFAFFLVVYAFAFSTPMKHSTRLVLLALSLVAALICNVIRLFPTSLIYGDFLTIDDQQLDRPGKALSHRPFVPDVER